MTLTYLMSPAMSNPFIPLERDQPVVIPVQEWLAEDHRRASLSSSWRVWMSPRWKRRTVGVARRPIHRR